MMGSRIGLFFVWLPLMGFSACGKDSAPISGTQTPIAEIKNSAHGNTGGVIDGSGGNIIRSSRAEVHRALDQVLSRLRLALLRFRFYNYPDDLILIADYLSEKPLKAGTYRIALEQAALLLKSFSIDELIELQNIFSTVFSNRNILKNNILSFLDDPSSVEIERKENGPCHSENGPSDSAVAHHKICFSIERLAEIPKNALPLETSALALHEFAHVYEFNETQAQLAQRFFLFASKKTPLLLPRSAKISALQKSLDLQGHLIEVLLIIRADQKQRTSEGSAIVQTERMALRPLGSIDQIIMQVLSDPLLRHFLLPARDLIKVNVELRRLYSSSLAFKSELDASEKLVGETLKSLETAHEKLSEFLLHKALTPAQTTIVLQDRLLSFPSEISIGTYDSETKEWNDHEDF